MGQMKVKYYFEDHEPVIAAIRHIETGMVQEILYGRNPAELISRCLYTGLKDKNGQEIYEDDIVQIETGFKCYVKWNNYYNAFMGFSASGSYFLNDAKNPDWGLTKGGKYSLEVIGNIHENPELLD